MSRDVFVTYLPGRSPLGLRAASMAMPTKTSATITINAATMISMATAPSTTECGGQSAYGAGECRRSTLPLEIGDLLLRNVEFGHEGQALVTVLAIGYTELAVREGISWRALTPCCAAGQYAHRTGTALKARPQQQKVGRRHVHPRQQSSTQPSPTQSGLRPPLTVRCNWLSGVNLRYVSGAELGEERPIRGGQSSFNPMLFTNSRFTARSERRV